MILSASQIVVFLLIFTRIAGLLGQAAFFSYKSIPNLARITICFFVTLVLWSTVPVPKALPLEGLALVLAMGQEYLLGRLMGFVSFVIVQSIVSAGDMMGMTMGLSAANQFDPNLGLQVNILGQLFDRTALMFFLVIDGHIMILTALQRSFMVIPIFTPVNFIASMPHIIDLGVNMWELAVRLSAPVTLTILLMNFALGTISRVAPQVNVFQLGFQVMPMLGLITVYLMVPLLVGNVVVIMGTIMEKGLVLLQYLRM
jgi:flagellar biosynthetic protein FliR